MFWRQRGWSNCDILMYALMFSFRTKELMTKNEDGPDTLVIIIRTRMITTTIAIATATTVMLPYIIVQQQDHGYWNNLFSTLIQATIFIVVMINEWIITIIVWQIILIKIVLLQSKSARWSGGSLNTNRNTMIDDWVGWLVPTKKEIQTLSKRKVKNIVSVNWSSHVYFYHPGIICTLLVKRWRWVRCSKTNGGVLYIMAYYINLVSAGCRIYDVLSIELSRVYLVQRLPKVPYLTMSWNSRHSSRIYLRAIIIIWIKGKPCYNKSMSVFSSAIYL